MNIAPQLRSNVPEGPKDAYAVALAQYLSLGTESALGQAYEIGRSSLRNGISLFELASLHHASLSEILRADPKLAQDHRLLSAAAEFLANCLSPYEMAHRGFQDAVAALRRMNETLEEEIKRIAHAVHDEAGQLLVYVHLALASLSDGATPDQKESFQRITQLLNQVETQLRQLSHELRPAVLDDLGLVPALRFLADGASKRSNLRIEISADFTQRLSGPVEIALYRIIQEALTNASKHARAQSLFIRLWAEGSQLLCTVEDDGVGFAPRVLQSPGAAPGLGLLGMRERLHALGGTLEIASSPGSGTKISLRLPIRVSEGNDAHSRVARG